MNFILIGAAGYVAPRHIKAIKEVGGNLIAAYDPNDSVGILDSYSPDCKFFTTLEEMQLWVFSGGIKIDYVSVCSPNYLHVSHIAFGFLFKADVICEKPLCLTKNEVLKIEALEEMTGQRVFTILQLRLHPTIKTLKERIKAGFTPNNVKITYQTPRGEWYSKSWKAEKSKSGGIAMNIGLHLFDMLIWLFGDAKVRGANVSDEKASGHLAFQSTFAFWQLSIEKGAPIRRIELGDEKIDFTDGFTDLHTESYREILDGRGFGLCEARKAVELVNRFYANPIS